jgi:DNA-binding LacI/PurR family transcriptional regulator
MSSGVKSRSKEPKYWRWAGELRRRIAEGDLRPGDRLPSYTEMRRQHGISQPTLDRVHVVLEQEGLIVREPRRGIFVASAPARAQTGVVGCLSSGLTRLRNRREHRFYWSHLFDGIMEGARQADCQVLFFDPLSRENAWEKVDGVLMTGQGEIHRLLPGLSCVSLLYAMPGVTTVRADNALGARDATNYLLKLGHRRIGSLVFADSPVSLQRVAACQTALEAAGIEFKPPWLRSLTEPGEKNFDFVYYGEQRMAAWLQEDWHELGLTALLCENDQTAIGAINACRKAGLRVPEDVSIVGFDGTEVSEYSRPALTTVEVPLEEIGRRGVQELLARIEERETRVQDILLPTQLKVRASTCRISSE